MAPQLLVNSLWSRHELTATLRGSYWDYDTFGRMDRPLVDTKVNGRYDITSLARIDVEGRYYLGTNSPGSPNIQADLKWLPIYHQVGGTVGFGQRINRFDFIGRIGGDRTTYTDSHFEDGQTASNADRNFKRFFTTGRINFELSPGVIPFTEFNADTRVYDRYLDAGGDHRNSQGVSGKIGSSFLFLGTLTGEASVGYQRRRYDTAMLPSFGAYLVDASLIWTLNALTTARFTAVTSVGESRLTGVSGVLTREYTAQIDHAFRRWLIGTLRFSRGMDDYIGSPRLDLRYVAAAQLTYMLTRDWWVRAEYRNEWRDSNVAGPGLFGQRLPVRCALAAVTRQHDHAGRLNRYGTSGQSVRPLPMVRVGVIVGDVRHVQQHGRSVAVVLEAVPDARWHDDQLGKLHADPVLGHTSAGRRTGPAVVEDEQNITRQTAQAIGAMRVRVPGADRAGIVGAVENVCDPGVAPFGPHQFAQGPVAERERRQLV